jgi:NAD(P)-dependent dehydrogenase (short-subunit alcohol dehydrogenase family)
VDLVHGDGLGNRRPCRRHAGRARELTARPFDFSGATAVVVGGASGLGRAMAEGLASHGARVCIVARNEDKARRVAEALTELGGGACVACAADLESESAVLALGETLDRAFDGRVHIAVNCAGINIRNPIEKIGLEEWEHVQRVNATGAFLFSRTMYPRLKQAGWGRLIHVTSIFATRTFPHRVSYASSKGALLQLTRTLALEWATDNITVNAISPGPFATDMMKPVLDDPERAATFLRRIPLGRFGDPIEVVTACLFLASRGSSYVTGAEILVDGGWTAT